MFFLFFLSLTGLIASNCPNGTYPSLSNPNQCFYFGVQSMAYMNAEKQCLKFDGHLTTIQSVAEDLDLSQSATMIFNDTSVKDFWFGANAINGKWAWQDGSELNFTYWDVTEPNNQTDNICGAISLSNGKWSAQKCFSLKPYICEFFVKETTTTSTVEPTTTACIISEPSNKCSDQKQRTCGECLKKRIKQVCSRFSYAVIKHASYCPIRKLEKMCCEKECSDCDIQKCTCPYF